MKNNKLKNVYSKFELVKSDASSVILNSELESVRGGRSVVDYGCGATISNKCGKKLQ